MSHEPIRVKIRVESKGISSQPKWSQKWSFFIKEGEEFHVTRKLLKLQATPETEHRSLAVLRILDSGGIQRLEFENVDSAWSAHLNGSHIRKTPVIKGDRIRFGDGIIFEVVEAPGEEIHADEEKTLIREAPEQDEATRMVGAVSSGTRKSEPTLTLNLESTPKSEKQSQQTLLKTLLEEEEEQAERVSEPSLVSSVASTPAQKLENLKSPGPSIESFASAPAAAEPSERVATEKSLVRIKYPRLQNISAVWHRIPHKGAIAASVASFAVAVSLSFYWMGAKKNSTTRTPASETKLAENPLLLKPLELGIPLEEVREKINRSRLGR